MIALYVLDVPETTGLLQVAEQLPAVRIRGVGPYFELSADDAIVIDRRATGMRHAVWYACVAGTSGAAISQWDKDALRLEPVATEAPTTIPSSDFDHHDDACDAATMRGRYEELRRTCPVARVDRHGGFTLVSGYDEVREATTAAVGFSSAGDGVFVPPSGLPSIPALEFEGADHRTWRRALDALMSPAATRALEPLVRETVDTQIDRFVDAGRVDLVQAFTHPVPGIVIGRMLGLSLPESLRSQELADAMFASIGTAGFPEHVGAFAAFTLERLHARRSDPRDDVLTQLATGEWHGMAVDDETAVQVFVALLGGGHHSTASGLAGLVHHVLERPEVRERVASDPAVMKRAVEESLRLTTPLQLFARTTTCPTAVGGRPLPEGERVLLNFAAANRDPIQFDRPDDFDVDRARNRHLAFGSGRHVCVGQHLARLELRVALERLLTRLPDLKLDGDAEYSTLIAGQLMTMRSMPVRFTPRP